MSSWVLIAEYSAGGMFGCTFEADDDKAEARGKALAEEHGERRGVKLVSHRVKKSSGLIPALSFDEAPITSKKLPIVCALVLGSALALAPASAEACGTCRSCSAQPRTWAGVLEFCTTSAPQQRSSFALENDLLACMGRPEGDPAGGCASACSGYLQGYAACEALNDPACVLVDATPDCNACLVSSPPYALGCADYAVACGLDQTECCSCAGWWAEHRETDLICYGTGADVAQADLMRCACGTSCLNQCGDSCKVGGGGVVWFDRTVPTKPGCSKCVADLNPKGCASELGVCSGM